MRSAHEVVAASAAATARDRLLIAAKRGEAMGEPSDQLGALADVASALSEAEIPYALIGGIAVGIHSEVPRATQDVDIAVISTIPKTTMTSAVISAGFEFLREHPHSVSFRHAGGEPVQVAMEQVFDSMIDRAES